MSEFNFIQYVYGIVIAVIAVCGSIISVYLTWKKNRPSMIGNNRLSWISNIRELMMSFIHEYQNNNDSTVLTEIKFNVMLFMREGNPRYQELIRKMEECIQNEYSDEKCEELVHIVQKVLSEVWQRIKLENGISKRMDKKYENMFNK